jgi:transposase
MARIIVGIKIRGCYNGHAKGDPFQMEIYPELHPKRRLSAEEKRMAKRIAAFAIIGKGGCPTTAAKRLHCSLSSVYRWLNKIKEENTFKEKRRGRPTKLSEEQQRELFRAIRELGRKGYKEDPFQAKNLTEIIFKTFGVRYHRNHIPRLRKYLRRHWNGYDDLMERYGHAEKVKELKFPPSYLGRVLGGKKKARAHPPSLSGRGRGRRAKNGNQGDHPLDIPPGFLYSPARNTLSNPVGREGGVWPLENETPLFFQERSGVFVFKKDLVG